MTIHVIDTNIVLRYLLADEPEFYRRATVLMGDVQAGRRKAYMAESAAAECILVLTKFYKVPKEEAAMKLAALLDYKGFTGENLPILRDALSTFIAHKIAFVDAVLLATARHKGWHLETFDKTLAKLAAT
jgi:predicted nucleic-acid-binding protein